ncbi:MAG: Bax inhibitor-1/YccA family protein [Asticcacaulis sp.]
MSQNDGNASRVIVESADMAVDSGLRSFMLGIYNKMALGLLITGVLAWVVGNVPEVTSLFFANVNGKISITLLGMIVSFAPIVLLFGSSFLMRNPSPASASMLYWTIVAMIGLSGGLWFIRYTGGSIAQTFFITAASFGALSLWGYTTKKNLLPMGSFLLMAVIGLLLAALVNLFLQSPLMHMIISGLGVLIFAGLIAFDTQRLKMMYDGLQRDSVKMNVATTFGALSLYINFINLFQFLLSFLGSSRD